MDTHSTHESKSINSSDEDMEMNHQTFVDQTKIFEDMKLLLTSQQASLKHNLDVLQTKATRVIKPKVNKKGVVVDGAEIKKNFVQDNVYEITTSSDRKNEKVTEHIDSGHSRQWSHSTTAVSPKSREDIQICPICAIEFDDPENPQALEEHVAGHWGSTDH